MNIIITTTTIIIIPFLKCFDGPVVYQYAPEQPSLHSCLLSVKYVDTYWILPFASSSVQLSKFLRKYILHTSQGNLTNPSHGSVCYFSHESENKFHVVSWMSASQGTSRSVWKHPASTCNPCIAHFYQQFQHLQLNVLLCKFSALLTFVK